MKPDSAAAWQNEFALASALGLQHEAELCKKNASDPVHATSVAAELLPGTLRYKPVSLEDFAAAVSLMSDSTSAKEGRNALIAFRDDVSGIRQATQEEIDQANRADQEVGLPPSGPWATAEPPKPLDALAAAFSLRSATPMRYSSGSRSGMASAMLLGALSGMQANSNPSAAEQTREVAQREAERSTQVPSHNKGGSFELAKYTTSGSDERTRATRRRWMKRWAKQGWRWPSRWGERQSCGPSKRPR
ncbi:MAG: hypothetical protein NVS1B11_01750 [Terriglobales bacterium]